MQLLYRKFLRVKFIPMEMGREIVTPLLD
jgi:hypothetical protein